MGNEKAIREIAPERLLRLVYGFSSVPIDGGDSHRQIRSLRGRDQHQNDQAYYLPDIDGYEVARRWRASSKRELKVVPIIAITANALKGDAEKALNAGCDVYMSKPINIRELWARVEAFVSAP